MPSVVQSMDIDGPFGVVWQAAAEMEKFPEFMPDVISVEIREGSAAAGRTISEWVADNDGEDLIWTEEDLFDRQAGTIIFRQTEGQFEVFEGQWTFTPHETGQTVTACLEVCYDLGFGPETMELIGDRLQSKFWDNTQRLLEGLKTRVAILITQTGG